MSPFQKAQIQLRLAAVAAERAIEQAKVAPTTPPAPTNRRTKPVKHVGRAPSVTDATVTDAGNAARQARHRAKQGEVHKAAEAERKRQARAAKKSA